MNVTEGYIEVTCGDLIQISKDLLEQGINAQALMAKGGKWAAIEAWCELGDEGWAAENNS